MNNSKSPLIQDNLEKLFTRFNEPVIPMSSIEKWLSKFDDADLPAAIMLLDQIELHSQPRLTRETIQLHEKVKRRLAAGGFDQEGLSDVDFSREFTCKSGDVVSYFYRKTNLIPSTDFKTFDYLTREVELNPWQFRDKALVILDDYIGTGSQFIFHFIGRSEEDIRVINSFKKVYVVCYIIHESALEKFWMLAEGNIEEVISTGQRDFPDEDFSEDINILKRLLRMPDWRNIELIYLDVDYPMLSSANRSLSAEEKKAIEDFLSKFRHDGYAGTSFLQGHHTFFYGAPNSLPEILWPLFKRVEDMSIYANAKGADRLIQETGEVSSYNIDEEG